MFRPLKLTFRDIFRTNDNKGLSFGSVPGYFQGMDFNFPEGSEAFLVVLIGGGAVHPGRGWGRGTGPDQD
jgi:hypothetical protein